MKNNSNSLLWLIFIINLKAYKASLWRGEEERVLRLIFYFINIFSSLIIILVVLINVAFITLLERKILGYSQLRLGPNKVSYAGIIQPLADAIKLLINQYKSTLASNYRLFIISPTLALILVLILWNFIPVRENSQESSFTLILLIALIRFSVYPLLISGWSSNRKYALLGRVRAVAQSISYEINLALIFLFFIVGINNFRLIKLRVNKLILQAIFIFPIIFIFWLISCLAETNRAPFDFAEGESELVSGFNIEYGSGGFMLLFLAEYARIYFFSILTIIFIVSLPISSFLGNFLSSLIIFFWVWRRRTLPRYRYDLLIRLAWKSILPLILSRLIVLLVFTIWL